MKYILLIYANLSKAPKYTPEQRKAAEQINSDYITVAQSAGVLARDDGFHIITKATTVRVRDDRTLIVDKPFAETEEQLTGYIMLDCKDLDEAIRWAAKTPGEKYGSVEVRSVDAYSRS
jgi:hypothetical protein